MMTLPALEQRLTRAAALLHQLPAVPESALETWPIAIQKLYCNHIRPSLRGKTLNPVSNTDLLELNDILTAMECLTEEQQRLIWLKAEGVRWAALQQWFDESCFCLQAQYKESLNILKAYFKHRAKQEAQPISSSTRANHFQL